MQLICSWWQKRVFFVVVVPCLLLLQSSLCITVAKIKNKVVRINDLKKMAKVLFIWGRELGRFTLYFHQFHLLQWAKYFTFVTGLWCRGMARCQLCFYNTNKCNRIEDSKHNKIIILLLFFPKYFLCIYFGSDSEDMAVNITKFLLSNSLQYSVGGRE